MSRTFRLGVFIVATLSMLAIGTFLIGDRQFLFSRTYQVKTTFKTVAGLVEGAEVRIGGVHKGIVKKIELPDAPDGNITLLMNLERSTTHVVKSDSVATIGTEGLLGAKFVEVSFGSDEAPEIQNGGSIASTPAVDMSDLVRKTNDILQVAGDAMPSVRASAVHLENISAKIDGGRGTAGALVNDRKVFDQINQGASSFQEDMEALKHNFFLKGFFNNRGYADAAKLDDHLIAQLPKDPPLKEFHYAVRKLFNDAEHAKLKSERMLDEAGHFLESNPFGMAVIVASGGMKGDTAELHTLLQARAFVIRDYLVKTFKMDDTRLKTMDVGKNPESPDDAGTVDVFVYPTSVRPVKTPQPPGR